MVRKYSWFVIYVFFLLSCSANKPNRNYEPSNGVFTYLGRCIHKDNMVYFSYPGFQIKFDFKGAQLKLGLQTIPFEGNEVNYYYILVNNSIFDSVKVNSLRKAYLVTLPDTNQFYTITVFKKTESFCGTGVFYGAQTQKGIFRKTNLKSRKTLWIGDSFMCGYGNRVSIAQDQNPNTGFHAKNEDNYWAFGSITSRALNAEYSCVAYSGKGVYRNYDGSSSNTIPVLFKKELPSLQQPFEPKIDYNLIVVKLGTNDFGPEMNGKKSTDSTLFVNTYISFLKFLHSTYPRAKIALVFGGGLSDVYPVKIKRLSRYRSMMQSVYTQLDSAYSNVFSLKELKVIKGPYGENYHPTIKAQKEMADQLIPFLKDFMSW